MPLKNNAGPDKLGLEDARPVTPTAGRRHRPSSKPANVETPQERRERAAKEEGKAAAARRGKTRRLARKTGVHEDKREDPKEMVTDAKPKNLGAESNNKHRKGNATHALETSKPGQRPSRKSTRRSANRSKRDSQQRRQTTRAVRSPKSRQSMKGA